MKTFILNPFRRINRWPSLIYGIITIVITAFIASAGKVHQDGVLDLHITRNFTGHLYPVYLCLAEGMINWLLMVVLLGIAATIINYKGTDYLTLAGSQAMARFPYLISVAAVVLIPNEKVIRFFENMFIQNSESVALSSTEVFAFVALMLIMIAMTVWMVILMYRSFSVSSGQKGAKTVIVFVFVLLLAEMISKHLITKYLY